MSFGPNGSLRAMSKTTHVIEHAQADLVYDVHGPLPTADGRPPLLMIGQPMDASGFARARRAFPGPHGRHLRPARPGPQHPHTTAATDAHPREQADDLHALIEALGAGPVDMFASSGGAVTALALVAAHPDDVRDAGRARAADDRPCCPTRTAAERARDGRPATPTRPRAGAPGWPRSSRMTSWQGEFTDDVLRAARARPGDVRHADRGRRHPRRPAAVRPRRWAITRLPPGRRRARRRADPDRDRGRRGVASDLHRPDRRRRPPRCSARRRPCSRATTAASSAASSATPASPRRSRPSCARSSADTRLVRWG